MAYVKMEGNSFPDQIFTLKGLLLSSTSIEDIFNHWQRHRCSWSVCVSSWVCETSQLRRQPRFRSQHAVRVCVCLFRNNGWQLSHIFAEAQAVIYEVTKGYSVCVWYLPMRERERESIQRADLSPGIKCRCFREKCLMLLCLCVSVLYPNTNQIISMALVRPKTFF